MAALLAYSHANTIQVADLESHLCRPICSCESVEFVMFTSSTVLCRGLPVISLGASIPSETKGKLRTGPVIKMAMSSAERLKKKREAEKKRRQRIHENPELLAAEKEKRRERERQKKGKPKKKLSAKEKKVQRAKWRLAKQRYNQKKKNEVLTDNNDTVSTRASTLQRIAKKRAESKRVKHYLKIKKLESQLDSVSRRASKYKMKYLRLKTKNTDDSVSPKSTLEKTLKINKEKVSPRVKRQLLLGEAITADIAESLSKVNGTKMKHLISDNIRLKNVEKYRLLTEAKQYFTFKSFQRPLKKNQIGGKRRHRDQVRRYVQIFLEDDENSAFSPSKGDRIVRRKVRKQKRFLTNSMKYLFVKFSERSPFKISYSQFCNLRPFWVVKRPVDQRDTCCCEKCANPRLMCQALKMMNLVSDNNLDKLIEGEMCCEMISEACRYRECENCADKEIKIEPYDGEEECHYYGWVTKVELGRDKKEHRHTGKERIYCTVHELVTRFRTVVVQYMKHIGNWLHQSRVIKGLRPKLTNDDLLLRIDFAENYACKYAAELQAIHFGGNRCQISLHTGVLYKKDKVQAFSTASRDLDHSSCAIFMHLLPIIKEYRNGIKRLHFASDGPVTQYRNRHMFFLLKNKIIPLFPELEECSWNFTEAGHGKSPADGVGALMKRTCDDKVAQGKDVSNFHKFSKVVKGIEGLHFIPLQSVQNKELVEEVTKASRQVKGTLRIHQVKWSRKDNDHLYFNSLSCFDCEIKCIHYHVAQLHYDSEPKLDGELECVNDAEGGVIPNEAAVVLNEAEGGVVVPNEAVDPNENSLGNIKEDDWIVARFQFTMGKGEKKWIGKILRVNENNTVLVTFVRPVESKLHAGFLYVFPNILDEYNVCTTQILCCIPPPTTFQRRLKFSVNSKDL